jgi:hypothetical protein
MTSGTAFAINQTGETVEMNIKLLLGILLFVIGLATAAVGIAGVLNPNTPETATVAADRAPDVVDAAGSMAIPAIAALSLAVGGLLIGISLGHWKHPRTHHEPGDEVVNPEGYHKMKHV